MNELILEYIKWVYLINLAATALPIWRVIDRASCMLDTWANGHKYDNGLNDFGAKVMTANLFFAPASVPLLLGLYAMLGAVNISTLIVKGAYKYVRSTM